MTAHQALIAAGAYSAGFITILLWLRSKITEDVRDQAPDENGAAGAGGADFVNHFDAASNCKGERDHA